MHRCHQNRKGIEMFEKRRRHVYYIYILKCCGDKYYVGQTAYLITRMWSHITGMGAARFTKKNKPCGLVHLEARKSRKEALMREKELILILRNNEPIRFHLPSEFNDFYYRMAAMADYPSDECCEECNEMIDIPLVKEWSSILSRSRARNKA